MKDLNNIIRIHKKLTESLSDDEQNQHQMGLNSNMDTPSFEKEIKEVWEYSKNYEPKVDFDSKKAFGRFKAEMLLEDQNKSDTKISINSEGSAKILTLGVRKWIYGLTACAAFLLVGVFFLNNDSTSPSNKYTAIEESLKVVLEDKSIVVLEKGATLNIDEQFDVNTRTTYLTGKAYFDIERNENKPFVINSEYGKIEVLGTAFNLDVDNDTVVLEVEEGLVAFTDTKNKTKELFKVGEKMIFDASSTKVVRSTIKDKAVFAWSQGGLKFINQPLSEVLIGLSDYFNVNFEYSTAQFEENSKNCPYITLTNIKEPNLTNILSVLKELSGLEYRYTNENKTVRIVNLDCN